jgi:hypothetical protein
VTTKEVLAGIIAVVIIITTLAGAVMIAGTTHTSADGSYDVTIPSVYAAPHENATNGQVALRVNGFDDASDPTIQDIWTNLSIQARNAGVYFHALAPPSGARYCVAHMSVTNVQHRSIGFTYEDMFVIARDNHTYYANYAVCDTGCSASALRSRTLSAGFSSDLYVLFSLPTNADPVKLVYTSDPPLVMALA